MITKKYNHPSFVFICLVTIDQIWFEEEVVLYKELTKRLFQKMLNSEMQNYLGYEKNQHSNNDNARNGISSKKINNSTR